jgi:high-affinity nickel-transport protein
MIESLLFLGLALGVTHATDADHVVAIATFVSDRGGLREAARIGVLWGLGHSLTVLLFGGAMIVSRAVIPPVVGLSLELGVALMLVGLGGRALVRARAERAHPPEAANHAQESPTHHARVHALGLPHRHASSAPRGPVESLAVGLVHGLAGSAAVALAVLTQVSDPRVGVAYLAVFGLGTIAGMLLVTTALALPLLALPERAWAFRRHVRSLAGATSCAIGLALVYDIGFTSGLFLGAPSWAPH